MEEKQQFPSWYAKERAVSLPPSLPSTKSDSEDPDSKKQSCLCAPTTHVGSFRCRLHRLPPSPALSLYASKKGSSSQKLLSPKVKLALHQKLKQGGIGRSSSSSLSQLQQDLPGLSRLSRASMAKEQKHPLQSDREAFTAQWKTSNTAPTGDDAIESVEQMVSSEATGEFSTPNDQSCIRPLIKMPSI